FFAVIALLVFVDTSGTAMLSLVASLLHEAGHFIAMLICKAELQSVLFYGGGICIRSDKDILCFWKRLFIVSAGCIVNLIIAVVGFFVLPYSVDVLIFAMVNVVICVFNLIPVGYFDGAEILDIICNRCFSFKICEFIKRVVGVVFSLFIILGFVYYCFVLKGNISISFLFVILYLILTQIIC
ncbi:MAG: peptidase M50, partial [Ruminiclostridium sp.]|nr:peptidase M50 [Ruminiclostridium sp.]